MKYPKPILSDGLVSQVFMVLSDWQDFGHCQVTYKSRTTNGDVLTYCLQDNGENFGGVRLMRCADDGEPSHETHFTKVFANFERSTGDSRLEMDCNRWIHNYEQQFKEGL
jgi:hypothetical protein